MSFVLGFVVGAAVYKFAGAKLEALVKRVVDAVKAYMNAA